MAHTKTIAELSVDARLLVAYLSKHDIDDEVTYDQLATHIGREVTGSTPSLQTAKRVLLRDHKQHWETIRGVGLKRMGAKDTVSITDDRMRNRVRNVARKAEKTQAVVDVDQLEKPQMTQFFANAALAGLLKHATAKKQTQKIRDAIEKENQELPMARLLRELNGKD